MNIVDIAGLKISAIGKQELLAELAERLWQKQKTFVVTPYSEFLYESLQRPEFRDLLNSADFSLADGIAILWASKFLSLPLTAASRVGRGLQTISQVIYTGAAILFKPNYIRSIIPEKITGADLIWDIAELAESKGCSIYLLGGFDNTSQLVADKLKQKFPQLKIAGYSNKNPGDESVLSDLDHIKPDILLVAFGPVKQEEWIYKNLTRLPVSLVIGLGGTFDYIAGVRSKPPSFVRSAGLEWLYRLITQPHRAGRIFNATFGLIKALVKHKISKKA